jgi:hypothetical protein
MVQLGTKGPDLTCTFVPESSFLSFPLLAFLIFLLPCSSPSLHTELTLPPTGNLIPPAIWTTIEPAVQITTACLPALRVLYRKFMDVRKQKARSAAQQRLRSLELTSPRDESSAGNDTFTYGSGTQGSWTTKDRANREGVVERDVYV